jgi:tRNA A37 threonylcarbamoyltransferase TsaD
MEVIVAKAVTAATRMKKDKLVLAGGVAANSLLRKMLKEECDKKGVELFYPSPVLCTDNAAMIGCAAYYKYQAGMVDDFYLDAYPNLALCYISQPMYKNIRIDPVLTTHPSISIQGDRFGIVAPTARGSPLC